MKVGIITFHNTSNYGAALQALATVKAIEEMGFDAEIIDYTSHHRRTKYSAVWRVVESIKAGNISSAAKYLVLSPGVFLRNRAFKKFYRKYLTKSAQVYRARKDLAKTSGLYDSVVAGSDQIWSYKNNDGDLSYLLDFVSSEVNKCSYASSFGVSDIPESLRVEYSDLLNKIDAISVREDLGRTLVKKIADRNASVVVDPVLLLDRGYWCSLAGIVSARQHPFDLVYVNSASFLERKISYADTFPRVPKISIGSFKFTDVFKRDVSLRNGEGPLAFLSYINSARFVYTTSYHAVLFCLIFNKPFYVFLTGDNGRDARIIQVLDDYDLNERAVHSFDKCLKPSLGVDFSGFNEKWSEKRKNSIDFLTGALRNMERI